MVSICALPLNKSVENHSFLGVSASRSGCYNLEILVRMVVAKLPVWCLWEYSNGGSGSVGMVASQMPGWCFVENTAMVAL